MPKFFRKDQSEHTEHSQPEDEFHPKLGEAGEVKTLMEWEAPSRPFRKKDRSYYTTIAILVILLVLIAFLMREFLLIGVMVSLAFVAYVLAFVPPNNVTYKLSTQGITIGDHFYFWHLLDAFWFKKKEGQNVMFIQTRLRFPGQLMLVLGATEVEEVKKIVARFLPYHEIPRTSLFDRWAEGLQRNFPLENPHKVAHQKEGCEYC